MTINESIVQGQVDVPAQTGISTQGGFYSNAQGGGSPFTGASATDPCNFIGPDGMWAIATGENDTCEIWVYNEGNPVKAVSIRQDGTVVIPKLQS